MRAVLVVFVLMLTFVLTGCPAGGIYVVDHASTREGDDIVLTVTVSSESVDVSEYCLDIQWRDADGAIIDRHRQCDTDLEENARETHTFRLVDRSCTSYEITSDVAASASLAKGDCAR